ncbi:hypothetical protein [Periweissella fabalis]|uniref:Uncharacterized protein n=1 Tax=Periweissella fabalis TaxID=1070421 RepID=A0A7X6N1A7_9LACO|nr:hypothetical protein [Periweissella fabalis]MCM0599158.1 hypothetical protein [Periweissella fabalis]NKZ23437.1 hypothetical protein [Periweissella fabalis]
MIQDTVFGNIKFGVVSFLTTINVNIFGENQAIIVDIRAYEEKDGITTAQQIAFSNFTQQKDILLSQLQSGLMTIDSQAQTRFTAKNMLIDRNGELALLFDDAQNEEDGLAVQLLPNFLITEQDSYL